MAMYSSHEDRNALDRFVDPDRQCDPPLVLSRKRPHDNDMNSPRKRRETDHSDDDDTKEEPKENAYHLSPLLNRGDMQCNPPGLMDEQFPPSQEYGLSMKADNQPIRKFGRVVGAKGYSLPEIQLLFALIHEKPPIDNSDWVALSIRYNSWAKENKKPIRTGRGLKDKLRKLARVSKDEKHQQSCLTPIQQEAKDCFKLINAASNVLGLELDKDHIGSVDYCRIDEHRDQVCEGTDDVRPLMHEIGSMVRSLIHETREVDRRLIIIEQMLESFKSEEEYCD